LVDLFGDMANQYQLIIPDLRGHGRSTNPSKQFTFKQAALDMMALLDHLNIKKCSGIGFSGGGCTLLNMAYLKPGLLTSMVLVSATPYFPESVQKIMQQYSNAEKTEAQWEALRKIHVHGDEQINLLCGHAAEFGKDPDDMNFTPAMLSTIETKTLVVQGDKDPLYPMYLTIELFESLANANLWILPNTGHGPISKDNLSLFKDEVQRFM
jgi:pimeloyl-ACP methyl ester carboxylesterase